MRPDQQERLTYGVAHALAKASTLIAQGKLLDAGIALQRATEGIASLDVGTRRDELIQEHELVKRAGEFRQGMREVTDNLTQGMPFASSLADALLGGFVQKVVRPDARARAVREQRREDLAHMLFDELRHALELLDEVGDPVNGADQSILRCLPLVLELGKDSPSCRDCGKPWSQHAHPHERRYLATCPGDHVSAEPAHEHVWVEHGRDIDPRNRLVLSLQRCACGQEQSVEVDL